jgi:hypothetical protein
VSNKFNLKLATTYIINREVNPQTREKIRQLNHHQKQHMLQHAHKEANKAAHQSEIEMAAAIEEVENYTLVGSMIERSIGDATKTRVDRAVSSKTDDSTRVRLDRTRWKQLLLLKLNDQLDSTEVPYT